jgi:hypothetical protein
MAAVQGPSRIRIDRAIQAKWVNKGKWVVHHIGIAVPGLTLSCLTTKL